MPSSSPATLALGPVGLAVRDLDRSLAFYAGQLGLDPLEQEPGRALLGSGGQPLVELVERRDGRRDPDEAGLFHTAFLVPDRAALGAILRRLREREVPLTGAADHVVSEAVYLDDPDGHGVELYADRPRESWYRDGRLAMANLPLDAAGIMAEAAGADGLAPGTRIGHIHLESHDVAAAKAFYVGEIGLDVMVAWPKAVFMSQGGYHHHLAVNNWNARRRPATSRQDRIGLLYYTMIPGTPSALTAKGTRMTDPSGIELRLEQAAQL